MNYIIRTLQITESGGVYYFGDSGRWVATSFDELQHLARIGDTAQIKLSRLAKRSRKSALHAHEKTAP